MKVLPQNQTPKSIMTTKKLYADNSFSCTIVTEYENHMSIELLIDNGKGLTADTQRAGEKKSTFASIHSWITAQKYMPAKLISELLNIFDTR